LVTGLERLHCARVRLAGHGGKALGLRAERLPAA
jgi:hypothetical protein